MSVSLSVISLYMLSIITFGPIHPSIHTYIRSLFLSIYCSARQCLRAYGKKITCFSLHSQWVIRGSRPAGGGNLFNRKRGGFIVHSFSSSPTHRFDMTEILYKMTENRKSSIHSLGAESRKKSYAKHFGYKLATGLHLKNIEF